MRNHFTLIAAILWSLLSSPAQALEEEDAKTEVKFSVAVKSLPRDWAKRVAAEKARENEELTELLEQYKGGGEPFPEDFEFLEHHREQMLPILQKATAKDWRAGGTAFQISILLGDTKARDRWFAEFRRGDAKTREELLALNLEGERRRSLVVPRTKEELAILHDALKGEQPVVGAIFLLEDPSPVAALILDQWAKWPRNRQWDVAMSLAESSLPPPEAARLLAWVREHALPEEDDFAHAFQLITKILGLGGETAEAAEKLFADLNGKNSKELLLPRSQMVAIEFCGIAGAGSRPLLDHLVMEGSHEVRNAAFAGLARLRGPAILAELEALAGTSHSATVAALAALAGSGAREQADAWALSHWAALGESALLYASDYGGPDVARRALAQIKDLMPDQRFKLAWRSNGTTLPGFFARLHERGLISRTLTPREIARAMKNRPAGNFSVDEILDLMHGIDPLLIFDMKGERQPPPYRVALHRFTSLSRGAFVPNGIMEKKLPPKKGGPEAEEGQPVAVEFGAAGKFFQFQARPLGVLYDVESVQAAVNRALEVAGKKERFLAFHTSDYITEFIFGPPEAWRQFAAEYSLPLRLTTATPEPTAPKRARK